jgi:hypothetical protein
MAWSSEKQSAYMKGYYATNKEKMLAKNRAYREKDPEHHLERAREYHHKNRERLIEKKRTHRKENQAVYAERRRLRVYGLAPEKFADMLAAQNGCCAVCGDGGILVVDHCHDTGKIRSLLCSPCNTAIGLFKEEPKRMRAAIRYLAKALQ